MKNYKAIVKVNLKPEIKDIKAKTLEQAVLHLIKVKNLKCSAGNSYTLNFEAENRLQAEKIVKTIAEEILSNSVIEEYEVLWEEQR